MVVKLLLRLKKKRKVKGMEKITKSPKTKETKTKAAPKTKAVTKKETGLTVEVFDVSGKVVGRIKLSKEVFGAVPNKSLMSQAVRVYLANQRLGNASAKTRGEVRGGGRKPWRQKGTGRARSGSIRSPLWRHGGRALGAPPRGYRHGPAREGGGPRPPPPPPPSRSSIRSPTRRRAPATSRACSRRSASRTRAASSSSATTGRT